MNFDARYKELNNAQKKAVDTIDGPLLVIAGPGSGKTEILALRVGQILKKTDTLASNILCLTFTDSASANMRNRLSGLIGPEAYHVAIHTFHSFCTELIGKHPEYFYSGAFFSPADELAQIEVLQNIFDNLPQRNPLKSKDPEGAYVHLRDAAKTIEDLKKDGITPEVFLAALKHNVSFLPEINNILYVALGERVVKDTYDKVALALENLTKLAQSADTTFPLGTGKFTNLARTVKNSLQAAYDEATEGESTTTPFSEWKRTWFVKNDDGREEFKDTKYTEKLHAFAEVYTSYRAEMAKAGYYDFADMILDAIEALEKNPSLRYQVQEQYQYILVDEFQDTNGAQMRLLSLITDAEVHEGRPNVMAVGDDDQAVYKFQGAEVSNILNFQRSFRDVAVVTMTDNYRSTQQVLDIAKHIIKKGSDRLEKLLPQIEKNLKASNDNLEEGNIVHKEFETSAHEAHYIAREIKKRIEAGEKPEEIAVIARQHKYLRKLVPYLAKQNIAVRYEQEQNVFDEPHIRQIITIAQFLNSLLNKYEDEADEYLPEILSFPFWKLSREAVWQVSLAARRGEYGAPWLSVMKESDNKQIRNIADFLIDLGVRAQSEPLELVLDEIIGATTRTLGEDEEAEAIVRREGFISPFKEFYFGKERYEHAKSEYLTFLSSLRVFAQALREYKKGEVLAIKDLVEFVDLHEKNGVALNDTSPFAKLGNAVNLLTAHKAKGLEFETVFILSCQDDIWAGRGKSSTIVLPANLPVRPAGDTEDDQLRLFYVAITRAKRYLYLTSYLSADGSKDAKKLRFLVHEEGSPLTPALPANRDEDAPSPEEVLTASWQDYRRATSLSKDENMLLKTLLSDYEFSVTHLNNFLNVERGGPQYFLEQNLLRFPHAKTSAGAYGTAIHSTLEKILVHVKSEKKYPKKSDILTWFEHFLKREKLSPHDFAQFLERGKESLTIFSDAEENSFDEKDIPEFNFKHQGVILSGAHLSGKIDKIRETEDGYIVSDYKTGRGYTAWSEGGTKLYEYERQLIFYKILLEHSRDFANKKKVMKGELVFVEPKGDKILKLELPITEEKTERLKKLIGKVHAKIMNLDFPDISGYTKDLKGIKQFEEDILEEKI